jgi:DNA-binding transcriptional ArsR family regulator
MLNQHLDTTFQALADPTRRAIVARLSSGKRASLSDLATPFDMSLPGVMKHVSVLEAAGLIEREKIGRTVFCRLNTAPMSAATNWLQEMSAFWSDRLDALSDHLEQQSPPPAKSQAPANQGRDEESQK